MLKLARLFFDFIFCEQGRVRVAKWHALRKACLDRAYQGLPRKGAA